jgi:hypothetical protein
MSIPTWEEAAESEFWERLPQDLHEQAVRDYLGSNGDAIDGRVQKLIGLADTLFKSGRHGPSVVASVIALEVMIHSFPTWSPMKFPNGSSGVVARTKDKC